MDLRFISFKWGSIKFSKLDKEFQTPKNIEDSCANFGAKRKNTTHATHMLMLLLNHEDMNVLKNNQIEKYTIKAEVILALQFKIPKHVDLT